MFLPEIKFLLHRYVPLRLLTQLPGAAFFIFDNPKVDMLAANY
jgi:hypothetical protein